MHLEQRLEFIDSLPSRPASTIRTFADSPSLYTPDVDPSKAGATVGPDLLNIYVPGVSVQNRTAVDYCKLIAQQVATGEFHPTKQLYEWYKSYTDTLAILGWVTQVSQTKNITIKKSALTMDAVAFETLQGLLGANATQLVSLTKKVVDGVKNDQGLVTVFEKNKTIGYEAKFEISPVWQSAEGAPTMVISCNSIDVKESKNGILWWKSTSQSTDVKSGAYVAYLNMDLYSKLREKIEGKALDDAQDLLANYKKPL